MATSTRDQSQALSVPEMLRIMDAASALRQDRELVDEQLNLNEIKARLRERMIAASKVTGEEVTPEEVDAAINTYYARLHRFEEPKMSFPVALAHLWVRRSAILIWGGSALGALLLGWWLFVSSNGPFSGTGRTSRALDRLSASVQRHEDAIRAVAQDPKVDETLNRLKTEVQTYTSQRDPQKLASVDAALANLEARVLDEYTISIVPGLDRRSGIDRFYEDESGKRVSGFYLIVEAKAPDGSVLSRTIHDSETGKDETVKTWGERVSREVYDRVAKDKKEDGILDKTAFSVKKKGALDEEILILGDDGHPLIRAGQITSW